MRQNNNLKKTTDSVIGVKLNKIFIAIIFQLTSSLITYSQDFTIIKTDDSDYPLVKLYVAMQTANPDNINQFKLISGKNTIPFTVYETPLSFPAYKQTIGILTENSHFFYRNNFYAVLKAALLSAINQVTPMQEIHLMYFGNTEAPLMHLGMGYEKYPFFIQNQLATNFKPLTDSLAINNNLFSGINSSATFLQAVTDKYKYKVLIIISRALNLDTLNSLSDTLIPYLRNNNFIVYPLIYETESQNADKQLKDIALATGGDFNYINAITLEKTLNQTLEKIKKYPVSKLNQTLTIEFDASGKLFSDEIELQYITTKYKIKLSATKKINSVNQHINQIIIVLLIFVVILVSALFLISRKVIVTRIRKNEAINIREILKKNKQLQSELDQLKNQTIISARKLDDFDASAPLTGIGGQIPLLVVKSEIFSKRFELTKLVSTIGRDNSNDIVIPVQTISGKHATISHEGGIFFIADNNSTNGIFINDIKITKSKVSPGDIIRMGDVFIKIKY